MADRLTFSSWMANLQVRFFTLRRGRLVGTDAQGNRYYEDRKGTGLHNRARRWVIYSGEPEASKVPPEWHGWLHHAYAAPLAAGSAYHKSWVKPHQPNLTGTAQAYLPPGHQLSGGQRAKATGDYEAWQP
jgi:NADH:ubiquinone oxidoreductase subunit